MNNIQGAVAAKNVFIRYCLTSKLAGGVFHGWQCLGHRDAALQPVGGHPTSWPLSRIRRFRCGLPPILKNANLVSIPSTVGLSRLCQNNPGKNTRCILLPGNNWHCGGSICAGISNLQFTEDGGVGHDAHTYQHTSAGNLG